MKLELVMDTNRMELFRQAAVMKAIGLFTIDEIRRHIGYPEIVPDEQDRLLINIETGNDRGRDKGDTTLNDILKREVNRVSPDQPETPHSKEKRLPD